MRRLLTIIIILTAISGIGNAQIQTDRFETSEGYLEITFIGHGSLMFKFQDLYVHVDPYSQMTEYSDLPKADLILITHEHRDHLDTIAIDAIRKENTQILLTPVCYNIIEEGITISNNKAITLKGISIESVPAYNIVHKRDDGLPYHPKGVGNGYVISFGNKRVYVAGDTEDIPEMEKLSDIDIAFLPMNIPFTMTPEMTANAARMVKPQVLYPYHYHYGDTDINKLTELLENDDIDLRIRY